LKLLLRGVLGIENTAMFPGGKDERTTWVVGLISRVLGLDPLDRVQADEAEGVDRDAGLIFIRCLVVER